MNLPDQTRLAVRTSYGVDGRSLLTVRLEIDGRPMSMTFECENDPGDVSFFCGAGLARVGGFEIVERDWMAS